MYSFLNDYSEGAHPRVMDALIETNEAQSVGYGMDEYCRIASDAIYKRIGTLSPDIHFLVGGTQTNLTFISHCLKDYQAVIACDSGHINVHETGAVEATGHKILTREHHYGKVTVEMIEDIVKCQEDEHMVEPKMVYISQTTEWGTYYTLSELEDIHACCQENDLYLFMDGARLGSALVLEDAPTLKQITQNVDAFYIGGTKMGALFGEALVICHDNLKEGFRYQLKNKGAMLAKGRLLGVQFYELLKDDLYEEIGLYENKMADKLRVALKEKYPLYLPSSTNQIFVDIPNSDLKEIEKEFMVTHMNVIDKSHTRIRLVTSWATDEKQVDRFIELVNSI